MAQDLFPESPEEHSYQAALIAEQMRVSAIKYGKSFCFETVFSHTSKVDFVAKAKGLGYDIVLVFIHVDSPSLNKARVHQRVTEGGHNVPDKLESLVFWRMSVRLCPCVIKLGCLITQVQ